MSAEDEAEAKLPEFSFHHVGFESNILSDRELREKVKQWGLAPVLVRFNFTGRFETSSEEAFAAAFLGSSEVQEALRKAAAAAGEAKSPLLSIAGRAASVSVQRLECSQLDMRMFDKLVERGLVSGSGVIRKCMEDVFAGVTVSDAVRELLANEDSENACAFEEEEKSELLFHIFRRLCIGGSMNQFDDTIKPYLDATRALYKDLVSVYRSARTRKPTIGTLPLQITATDGITLFPSDDRGQEHSFAYLCVDARNKQATFWYNAYVPFW